MRADRTIGILNRDRAFQNGPKRLPDVKALRLAADKDQDWLKIARHRLRRLCREDPRVLRRQGRQISEARHQHAITITNPRWLMKIAVKDGIWQPSSTKTSPRFRWKIAVLWSKIEFRDDCTALFAKPAIPHSY